MIDADHFKRYNDSYGHMAGDEVLKQVASVIQSSCNRSTDLAARYGGEEFVVVVVDILQAQSGAMAERLVQSVRALSIPHGSERVTIDARCLHKCNGRCKSDARWTVVGHALTRCQAFRIFASLAALRNATRATSGALPPPSTFMHAMRAWMRRPVSPMGQR
ncbi:GGDEF domain-containing protein [Mesorhizobium sp. M0174]